MTFEQFHQLADLSAAAVLLLDGRGTIVGANRGAARWLGARPEDLRGRDLTSLCIASPEVVADWCAECLRGTTYVPLPSGLRNALGRTVIGHLEGTRALGADGEPGQILVRRVGDDGNGSDRRLLQQVLDSTPAVIYVKGRSGRLMLVNQHFAELAGKPIEEIVGRTESDFFGGSWETVHANDRKVLDSGQVHQFEETLQLPDGGVRTYLSIKSPVSGIGETEPVLIGISTDVTERVLAEQEVARLLDREREQSARTSQLYQQVRDADRRKDEFLAMLAHELRNPLAPIRNALVLLGMDGLDAETAGQARDIMSRQVEHLVRLVDDLLDVSRIMRGKIELRCEPVDVQAIVRRAVETAQPLIASQNHELTVTLPQEPVWVQADLVRMAQVLGNLLNNAAKYTPPGGRIWLTVERHKDGVWFRVRDNGMGIEPDLLPHVFDLFTQAKRSIERSQGGLGIGLTLVRNLIEMHGGTVSADSKGPGQGSEFVVSLPSVIPTPQPVDAEWKPMPTRPLRVLVVEDVVGAARIMAAMLRKFWQHDVTLAHDGIDALAAARTFKPELVLVDIGLPGMSGYEVARRLREEPTCSGSVLVALTGYGASEDRQKSEEAGFDDHLVKPASVQMLQKLFMHPRLARGK